MSTNLLEQWCGFFYVPQKPEKCKCCEMRPMVFHPFLKTLIICRSNYKGNTFFSLLKTLSAGLARVWARNCPLSRPALSLVTLPGYWANQEVVKVGTMVTDWKAHMNLVPHRLLLLTSFSIVQWLAAPVPIIHLGRERQCGGKFFVLSKETMQQQGLNTGYQILSSRY